MLSIFSDTGLVSLVLYGLFIVITVAAMIVAFRQIKKGAIPTDKLDKMIDLFKYAVVSVAIATTTLIVTNLFKERDQDLKELEYFDKYAGDIRQADNLLVRLQLSKYFSIVSPGGEMKRSWQNYYNEVDIEYKAYLAAKGIDTAKLRQQQIIEAAEAPLASVASVSMLPSSRFVVNSAPNITMASEQEEVGFQALMNGEFDKAAEAFTKSENAKNGYHSSYELSRLLRINSAALNNDPKVRSEILKEIKTKHAAYAPPEVKEWLNNQQ